MDFINFEGEADNIDGYEQEYTLSDDDDDSFIDDASDISECVCEHYAFHNV